MLDSLVGVLQYCLLQYWFTMLWVHQNVPYDTRGDAVGTNARISTQHKTLLAGVPQYCFMML